MFAHELSSYSHIIVNLLFLLVFSINVEKQIGTKNFLILYFMAGLFAYISVNFILTESYYEIIARFKVRLKDLEILREIYNQEYKSSMDVNYAYGSSGNVFGVMGAYLALNIKNYSKSIFNLIILFCVTISVVSAVQYDFGSVSGGDFAHMGGFAGGLLFQLFLYFYRIFRFPMGNKNNIDNNLSKSIS
ncbi:MAG: rhomboid family intramembrane serine protease [Bacteroidota bacterium]|jgi:membrane associated rhomboid family serine protease